jgi:hypothetical protein
MNIIISINVVEDPSIQKLSDYLISSFLFTFETGIILITIYPIFF